MKTGFDQRGWADYVHWSETDRAVLRRLNALIEDVCRHSFAGIGKPESLRGDLSGCWSRRITGEHRLVYRVRDSAGVPMVIILQCRYHY